MKAEILELTWDNSHPTTQEGGRPPLAAFETHARRLRLQALGRACRDNQIETLLMGHHQDDNVETTLWRLATGTRSAAGLAGIPSLTRIPECNGLYGVSESGSSFPVSANGKQQERSVAAGGILICRPLLSFRKSSLLATCHANRIPFVTDSTNFDPTLTPRNAVRHLLSTPRRLPRALQTPSILALIETSGNQMRGALYLSSCLLHKCSILQLDLDSATMTVRFPRLDCGGSGDSSAAFFPRQIQSLALRRVSHLVSPLSDNHFPLKSFEPFTQRVFHPTCPSNRESGDAQLQRAFAVQGVMMRPVDNNRGHVTNTWFLSRQPFMRHRVPILKFNVQIPSSTPSPTALPTTVTSPWKLWDNRYWLRISISKDSHHHHHATASPPESSSTVFTVRPLRQSDLNMVYRSLDELSPSSSSRLRQLLSRCAQGPVRFTLPLITAHLDSGSCIDERHEVPLALPTVCINLPSFSQLPFSLHWEWMYKMIDRETLDFMTI